MIKKDLVVPCAPEEAFRAFTEGIGQCWPLHAYSYGGDQSEALIMEPREGGGSTSAGGTGMST